MKYRIPEDELNFEYTRSGGPGGQHVNRVQTAVQLRFDVRQSQRLPRSVKDRLVRLAGSRLNADGVLVIDARNERSQVRNKAEAIARLQELIDRASVKPKPRRATKPTKASQERRLNAKKKRAEVKKMRSKGPGEP